MKISNGMDRKKLIKRLLILIFFIFVANFFANKFFWYYSIWYFDMIMHFVGGLWVGLAALYFLPPQSSSSRLIFTVLGCVFVVGIGWELFELFFYNYLAQNSFYILDASSDIFFDLSGGVFAILYFLRRIGYTLQ